MKTEDLSVGEALSSILTSLRSLSSETVSLQNSVGRVLAAPAIAGERLPAFANSSMDGYVVRALDVTGGSVDDPVRLKVIGDIPAGRMPDFVVKEGTAARIMTGAPLPEGGDAVVPVEDTDEPWRDPERPLPSTVAIKRSVASGDYVRYPGEDVDKGDIVLSEGHVLRPQDLGLLASLGIDSVRTIRLPRVGIVATGDELIAIDEPVTPGKIRNSNSVVQAAQVADAGGIPIQLGTASDNAADLKEKLSEGLQLDIDLFLSSAGVSVGAYDVVKDVLDAEGDVSFWRVRMRPGKPLAFGRFRGVPYIGLPGNPVSAMVSFERFVRPAILKMGGRSSLQRPSVRATMLDEIKSDGRESYVRVIVERKLGSYRARLAGGQGSHIMSALIRANALAIVPEGIERVGAGESLEVMMIDWPESVF